MSPTPPNSVTNRLTQCAWPGLAAPFDQALREATQFVFDEIDPIGSALWNRVSLGGWLRHRATELMVSKRLGASVQQLPAFRYHPDPLDIGSIVPSDATCRSCGQPRGYVYTPPPSAEEDLESALCPWCIADGSAARQFDAEFTDAASVGGYGQWDEQVAEEIVEEVSRRTPGFSGWQEEKWWTHCGDAAEFLGPAGRKELESRWPEAIDAVRAEAAFDDEGWQHYFQALDRDHGPTAYVFRCLHCGRFGAYSDIH